MVTFQSDMFYSITEMLSNTFAINGKACLQRLICELAEVPIKDLSLMAEFLHFIVEWVKQLVLGIAILEAW